MKVDNSLVSCKCPSLDSTSRSAIVILSASSKSRANWAKSTAVKYCPVQWSRMEMFPRHHTSHLCPFLPHHNVIITKDIKLQVLPGPSTHQLISLWHTMCHGHTHTRTHTHTHTHAHTCNMGCGYVFMPAHILSTTHCANKASTRQGVRLNLINTYKR